MRNMTWMALLGSVLFIQSATAEDIKITSKGKCPKYFTKWTTSKDGKISLSLATEKVEFPAKRGIVLRCAIRNDSGKSITIQKPFGDYFYACSHGLTVTGPNGVLKYVGPMKEYMLGTSAFTVLKAGMVCEQSLILTEKSTNLKGINKPGKYTIAYKFTTGPYPGKKPIVNLWNGQFTTNSIQVKLK